MLLPADRTVLVHAVTAYRGLRSRPVRLLRRLVAVAGSAGLARFAAHVRLEAAPGVAVDATPLSIVANAIGRPNASAAIGVRRSDNAKATLQMFDPEPVGYAKFAWDPQSATYVGLERDALIALDGQVGSVRVPRLISHGTWGDYPYIVTEPLPPDAHRPGSAEAPSADELLALGPVVREAVPAATAHLAALAERIRGAARQAPDDPLFSGALELLERVERTVDAVPVVARWHGDLVPWNSARAGDGTFWVWDWETVENDVVIGLDALHWMLHSPLPPAPEALATRLVDQMADFRGSIAAMGAPPHAADVAVAVYTLAMIDRSWGLATARGGWGPVRVGPAALTALVAAARRIASPHLA
jgi:hypothetical protein